MKTIFTVITLYAFALLFANLGVQAQTSPCDTSGYSLSLSVSSVSCPGAATGVATVASTGCTCMFSGCIFTWSNGQNGHTATGLSAGTYSVVVAHPNGCVLDTTVTITEPASFIQSVSKEDPNCNGMGDGSAAVIPATTAGPLTYLWSNGATDSGIDNLAAGKYFVTTTNFINCSLVDSVELNDPAPLATSASTAPSCASGSTGDVMMAISGGTPPYSCIWSNGATTENLENVSAGNYNVTAMDANGCDVYQSATVGELPSPQPNIIAANTDICLGQSTQLIATVSGGGTFSWSPAIGLSNANINAPIASPSQTTTYVVTTTSAHGCIGTAAVTVTVSICTDIVNTTENYQWRAYPNPFSDRLNVATQLQGNSDVAIRLYNALGQMVYYQKYNQQSGAFQAEINLVDLPQGVYVLEAQTEEGVYRQQVLNM